MNLPRLHITVFLAIAVGTWWLALYLQGIPLTREHLVPFGTTVSVLATYSLLMEKLLWRMPILHGWFIKRPNLRGTWKVMLQSDWVNPKTNQGIPPITCYMGVEQTLSKLQMHLMTPESESWIIAEAVLPSPSENGYQIIGVYRNHPQLSLRERSAVHYGALLLHTHGESLSKPETLSGEYWTDRKTTGKLTLTGRRPRVFTRYEDAAAAT